MSGRAPADEIEVTELDGLLRSDSPPAVLDVREPWEAEICRIPGSFLVPLARLPERLGDLPRDRMLVVACHHGVRSRQAASWLRANGYDRAVNLAGGVDAWARRIDTGMRTY